MKQIAGLRIIESVHMTEPGEPIIVQRSWKERLCTWPWIPWKSTKTVVPQIPRKNVFICEKEGYVLVHPEIAKILRSTFLS